MCMWMNELVGAAGRANARRARSSSRMDHMVLASGCAVQLYMPAVRRCEPERLGLGGTRGRAPPRNRTVRSHPGVGVAIY